MKLLYNVEDRPPMGAAILLALQHMLAAMGAIIAVPLVVGSAIGLPTDQMVILVNAALMVSGVVTIIQCKGVGPVGIRLPVVMGTSFTFVAISISIGMDSGISGVFGASLIGSLVMIIGSRFMPQIRKLFPPVVSGTVVVLIGLTILPVSVDWFAGGFVGQEHYGQINNLMLGLLVLVVVIVLSQLGKGLISAAAIVIGMMVGYIVAIFMGVVDFTPVREAKFFSLPELLPFGLSFTVSGVIGMSIAYLVTIMESTGDFLALSDATHTKLTGKKLSKGILCDGIGSALASVFGATPFSSFSQNVGIVSITGVASRHVVAVTGVIMLIAGMFPKLGGIVVTIPSPVLGGAGLVMFAMIISAGIGILSRINFTKRNMLIIAVGVASGMAVTVRPEILTYMPDSMRVILGSGITTGSLVALGLNIVLGINRADEAESANEKREALKEQIKECEECEKALAEEEAMQSREQQV
ncbi:nucleobase:cation symporter-2 family protein [Photobacterium lutimaris]|uniref:Xanthine permease n=1 Tax=Photobacterium lutimaris TaxID=388278 RepID=A0A2T3IZQ0_9GAMM|nr:nucleobase:cation symporter-2 family protein [Photobacterium lutimaris]PSU34154.1 xanthine permease [Photobacterium lutimaris]TDR75728.1 NCS2 family nucleobase:cation symporter-2 [Photobacterium lutimaris]